MSGVEDVEVERPIDRSAIASDPRRLDGEWWVMELDGAPVEVDRTQNRRPHLRFDFDLSRVSFTGGCNQFAGTVDFGEPDRISMEGPFAGTKMLCPGRADADRRLSEALRSVSHWRLEAGANAQEEGIVLDLVGELGAAASIRLARPSRSVAVDGAEDNNGEGDNE